MPGTARRGTRVEVSLPGGQGARPVDGRLLLFVSTRPVDDAVEPRFQVHEQDATQQVFGLDVEGWAPGTTRVLGEEANGYPVLRLSGVPPGEYTVQALLHVYETFRRADGHVVQLPADRGEGQSRPAPRAIRTPDRAGSGSGRAGRCGSRSTRSSPRCRGRPIHGT